MPIMIKLSSVLGVKSGIIGVNDSNSRRYGHTYVAFSSNSNI